jgi:hypothetical protein
MKLRHTFLNISIFGYTLHVFRRRVFYYLYLKFTKYFLYSCENLRLTYRQYIRSEDLGSQLNLKAHDLYILLTQSQSNRIKNERVKSVGEILKGRLEIFNYCLFSKRIDWKVDPISGYQWDEKTWYRDGRNKLSGGSDIKRPWELSRLYFLLPVAIEYFSEKDENLADYVIDCIEDWADCNPLGTAPNWSCTMEVAIRCANVVLALVLVSGAGRFKARESRFVTIINDHIGFILMNLENISKITSNHFSANIAGLYVSLKYLPLSSSGMRSLDFARQELETEITKQTLADGWNFELSSSYHRLVFEFFFYSYLISSPREFSEEFKKTLHLQCQVLNALVKPSGDIIQIGDNDSGRFIVTTGLQYLGSTWMGDSLDFFNDTLNFQDSDQDFYIFNQAGVYIVNKKHFYFAIKSGLKGQQRLGGHSHNDTFSFELQYKGTDIVIDPGTGTYTSDALVRNFFRSTAVHNTIFWEDIEESSLNNGLFFLGQENEASESVLVRGNILTFSGRNEYRGRWHERRVSVDMVKFVVEITDEVSSAGASLNFTLPNAPHTLKVNSYEQGGVVFAYVGHAAVLLEAGVYSPKYGVLMDASQLRVPLLDKKISTVISINDTI